MYIYIISTYLISCLKTVIIFSREIFPISHLQIYIYIHIGIVI